MFGFSRFTSGSFFASGYDSDPLSSPFSHEYSCYPVSFAGRDELEAGNKILLPPSALNQLARRNISWPMLFKVQNSLKHKVTHSGVLEFVAEEGTCYMPYWMMQNLELQEGDIVNITNTSLSKGTYVKLQPLSMEFLDITNPKAVLETALRGFATLTIGDTIVIQYNDASYKVEILETKPANAISIIETDIQVDFAPPPDYVEPGVQRIATTPDELLGTSRETLFSGYGQRLDGKPIKTQSSVNSMPSSASLASQNSYLTDDINEPWKNRLVGGVRTYSDKYQDLIDRGIIPGIIGVTSRK
ncbi:ubiquitin fusion degradation protein 1 [Cryptosporidium andersoni]|uniref:Ubiquitin fusion degradation protein 1 n=1 Tax=Cryptosporidium andersoni TaxID=117008 RepID=A0A1J4MCM4_9CRYT|nr:ubiquitin fusion degradation protein 1 [Cryptosporidium andersoni]